MNSFPRMLKVETGWLKQTHKYFPTDEFIDYSVYDRVPKWWRRIEQLLRLDIYLAIKANQIASQYDVLWANSEKVAIPLSFLNVKKPLVVILQFPESPLRVQLIRLFGLTKKWSGIGIVSTNARYFLQNKLGIDPNKIFQYFAIRTDLFRPAEDQQAAKGLILSLGVAKRDYDTLIAALAELPGYQAEIYCSSKYGDLYQGRKINKVPDWVQFPGRIPDNELVSRYQSSRFVVVPLQPTAHSGAGVTSALEASACGKAVIATDTGGMNSYIIPGKTGILVPPHDTRAMREAIQTLWENENLAAEMGRAGRKFVEENYNHDKVVCDIALFISNLWNGGQQVRK